MTEQPTAHSPIPEVDRVGPPLAAGERAMLAAFLDWHRATLHHKCAGLTVEQLSEAACPPSDLTLLGLMRHLTDVERGWFERGAGRDAPPIYYSDEDPEGDFRVPPATTFQDAQGTLEAWRSQCETSRAITAALPSLDDTAVGEDHTWRWIIVHMIEEYARHNGHADLIRQTIDGATGE